MTKENKGTAKLLPFEVIAAAAQGDTNALCKVVEHYDGYILSLEFMPYSLMLLDGITTISPEAVIRHSLGFFYIHRDLRCRSPPFD